MIESVIDQFIQLEEIGHGGFSTVYKVQERETGNLYAAKCLYVSIKKSSNENTDDAVREINIMCKLKHRAIIEFKYFSPRDFNNDKCLVIITEYIEKGSLSAILNQIRNKIPVPNWNGALKLINIYGIANAMSYLHSHNIIHRDLKPDNILMDNFLHPKVADFGIAKIIHSEKSEIYIKTHELKGTIRYMAPETFEKLDYTKACDVYSFGIIVYEIMTNLVPYGDKSPYLIPIFVSDGKRPSIPEGIPTSYKELIERCWAQEPQERPTFPEILNMLKNDRGFITDGVDENDYRNYVDYIDHQPNDFESDRQVLDINKIRPKPIEYPEDKLKLLSEECAEIVKKATNNAEDQFYVGQNLIEGTDDFPKDVELGIKYLEKAIENESIKSAIYYSRLLIKGEIIKKDLKKAKTILEKFLKYQNAIVSLLYGKIMKKAESYAAAKNYFEKSAEAGNLEANYELGKLYYKGIGCEQNEKRAKNYFKLAKVNGFNKSDQFLAKQMNLRKSLSNVPKDTKEKFKHFKQLADQNVPEAMYECGLMFLNGEGVEKSEDEALHYFKMAAKKGHQKSMINCGYILKEHNNKESVRYFEKAAKEGNPEGMAEYGRILFYGDGVPVDKHKALRYIRRSAENNNPKAMNIYAIILQNGDGIKADEYIAEKYFRKAIEAGNKDAVYNYAMMLLHSHEDLSGGIEIADYFKMAIDNGNSDAMYTYSMMLSNGKKVPVDKKEASRYFKMAIDYGNSDAMFDYATMLQNGDGIPKNENEASRYFKLSADKGNSHAMFNLSIIYLSNKGYASKKKEAARYFKQLADEGNSYAMYNYATMLLHGDGIQKNKEEAVKYYKMSIKQGNSDAMYKYATILFNEDETPENKLEAICYIKMSIKRGNIEAILKYAEMFIFNEHRCIDVFDFLQIGIEKGNTRAMLIYSTILLFGIGIKSEPSRAVEYIKLAIKKGDSTAMLNYSTLLLYGEGVPFNKEEAFGYLKMSIDKGNSDAMFQYGKIFLNGEHVPVNKTKASNYFQKAIEKGNSDAMFYYGKMIANSDFVRPDLDKASRYFKMSADEGNTDAMFEYAKMLLNGEGVSVNKSEASRYFKMSADEGNTDAMFEYAKMLLNGEGVSVNKSEALRYFKIAVDEGNTDAMFEYAKMLLNGEGVSANKSEASRYFKMSADEGNIDVMFKYAKMLLNGEGVSVNKSEASRYFKMAADKGNTDAMFEYAKMLLNGEGVSVNKSEALRYFKIAADKGNSKAMFEYAKINIFSSLLRFKTEKIKVYIHYLKIAGYTFLVKENENSIKYISEKEEFKPKLNEIEQELEDYKREANINENKGYTESILVCGYDNYNGLGEKPNNKANGCSVIYPPVKLSLDPSSIQSYSVYCIHAVIVMKDGSLKGVGYNHDGRISATLQKTNIDHFTDFCIKDTSGRQLAAISAVCYTYGTLYLFSKSYGNERQLVLCDSSINGGTPIFLDIRNHHPVSLFGGYSHSAAICRGGEVIFINRNSVINSPKSPITVVSLPNGEKASSVACCESSVVVLSLNGRAFISPIESNGFLNFSIVSELSNQEIVSVSGTYKHFLAVNKEGRVFALGSNEYGKLGLGKEVDSVSTFTEILSLRGYVLRSAYAGCYFSLFETHEGKILSCGRNYYGQLLLSSVPSKEENIYSPTETTITNGSSFSIAGYWVSAVFIGSGPPPNTPNTQILQYQ